MIDAKWLGEAVDDRRAEILLIAILCLSNDAERMSDPFTRRIALNEMQAAIQSAKSEIEAYAEGTMFQGDGNEEDGADA